MKQQHIFFPSENEKVTRLKGGKKSTEHLHGSKREKQIAEMLTFMSQLFPLLVLQSGDFVGEQLICNNSNIANKEDSV